MPADRYGDNNGFRNLGEFQQFLWLQEAFPDTVKMCHNFYVFDDMLQKDFEIDIGILTDRLLLLIEHKCSFYRAYDARTRLKNIHKPVVNLFGRKRLPEIPYINGVVMTQDCPHPGKKQESKSDKIYILQSEDETKGFVKKDFIEIEKKGRKALSDSGLHRIMDALQWKKYQFRPIQSAMFAIFDEIQKPAFPSEGKYQALSTEDRARRVNRLYDTFEPINYLLSKVFIRLERERTLACKPGETPFFNFRRASRKYLERLRPTYWVCAIPSEDEDEANQIQLGFHISKGPWYSEETNADPKSHIAIKLSFFEKLNENSLALMKQNIDQNRLAFKALLSALAERDPGFVFYLTDRNRNERTIVRDYPDQADQIAASIISYDESDGIPKPRSTEIVKFIEWDERVETLFSDEDRAVEELCVEFTKLLPLYYFMNNHAGCKAD